MEVQYTKGLIRKLRLAPPVDLAWAVSTEEWPFPVKINTLGRFEILLEEVPLTFSGKVQKKPLEMLKAVIAFGGTNVPADLLTDTLWPDAEGDLARKSFEVTLSRLRQLLGSETPIRYSAGQLSIDPKFCRVDSLVLEETLAKMKGSGEGQAARLCETAVGLYAGDFLPSDLHLAFTAHRRETLKNGLLSAVMTAGRRLERAGQFEKAAEYYVKGIETDKLTEELYQRLMICYRETGKNAEAVRTYRRCRDALKDDLGIEPSSRTEAVYTSLLQKR